MAIISTASVTTANGVQVVPARNRQTLIFENTDANRCYVLLDSSAASATNYSFSLATNENAAINNYHGEVKAIWAADGSGVLLTTEF
jgi:hypothetical protein